MSEKCPEYERLKKVLGFEHPDDLIPEVQGFRTRIVELEKDVSSAHEDWETCNRTRAEMVQKVIVLEERLETAETCMNKSQAALKELEMFHGGLINSYRECETERDTAESFSAAAKDVLEEVKRKCTKGMRKYPELRNLLRDIVSGPNTVLSDAPPLPNLKAARELCEKVDFALGCALSRKEIWPATIAALREGQALARRFLDSTKEKS